MAFDAHKNFAVSLVATAPSPATSGTSLVVTAGEGARFPAVPFNATICPANTLPTPANSEIVRVTAISTDTLTITRAQENSSARTVVVGDQIAATITAKSLTDIETPIQALTASGSDYVPSSANTPTESMFDKDTNSDVVAKTLPGYEDIGGNIIFHTTPYELPWHRSIPAAVAGLQDANTLNGIETLIQVIELPANYLRVGQSFQIMAFGNGSGNVQGTFQLRVTPASLTPMSGSSVVSLSNNMQSNMVLIGMATIQAVGASGSIIAGFFSANNSTSTKTTTANTVTTIDTTVAQRIELTYTHQNNNTPPSIYMAYIFPLPM